MFKTSRISSLPTPTLYIFLPAFVCFFLFATTVFAYEDTTELLSDKCIDEITAGAAGDNGITAFFKTPSTAFIDIEPRWWGDMDGFPTGCGGPNPGYLVTNMPYLDFQYDTFKYTFKDQAAVDKFIHDLPYLGGSPVNVIDTDYIKSNPRAKNFLSGDGRGPHIQEIIVTTDRKVDGFFVRDHNGQVITQDVRFDLHFLPPYAKTIHEYTEEEGSIFETSLPFRNYIRYEWSPNRKLRGEMVRNSDGTYSFVEPRGRTYTFGSVYLESGTTGEDPITCGSGRTIVPSDTVWFKTTILNDIIVHSPAVGISVGLAPQGNAVSADELSGDQTHYPDLDRYQEIGILDIRNLKISLKGGNDIYMYANEDLPYICP